MLAIDSQVLDLIFKANADLKPEELIQALGGDDIVRERKILDPDMQDPRFELELSPSMPFRRQGERRLMVIDDSVAPMRKDPRADAVVPLDLRLEKERLIAVCAATPVRIGRLNALGSWGDAVLVARDARDLRGICLIPWALDPTVDVSGKRRASRLSQAEFEEKLLAFDKRLEELDEQEILANLGPVNFERRDDLLIVDVLEEDGTWDLRRSMAMEASLAALDRFSLIAGAPAGKRPPAEPRPANGNGAARAPEAAPARAQDSAARAAAPAAKEPEPAPAPAVALPPLRAASIGDQLVLIFPRERFDLDVAAAIGKRDWDSVLLPQDALAGNERDRVFREGAGFVAPLEFLSEVFLEGKPLTRPDLDRLAQPVGEGARSLEVHCPRFGPALLLDVTGRGRFITSERAAPEAVLALL
ncbi:MAG TPA: hypothetical protein VK698_22145 [Kofleriaceae bacterium]|nr:hypothetical protein [Kofleriaceae bacterium]